MVRVDVVTHHQLVGAGRRSPVDESKVVTADIFAKRVKGDARFERLPRIRTFEVASNAAGKWIDLVNRRMDPESADRLVRFAGLHQSEWVGAGHVEWANPKRSTTVRREFGCDHGLLARLERRELDRELLIAELFERNSARGGSAPVVGDREM